MVRLKEADEVEEIKQMILFQFQYGAIKRGSIYGYDLQTCYISIPIWCD